MSAKEIDNFMKEYISSLITICSSSGSYLAILKPGKHIEAAKVFKKRKLGAASTLEVGGKRIKVIYIPPDKLILRLGPGATSDEARRSLYRILKKTES